MGLWYIYTYNFRCPSPQEPLGVAFAEHLGEAPPFAVAARSPSVRRSPVVRLRSFLSDGVHTSAGSLAFARPVCFGYARARRQTLVQRRAGRTQAGGTSTSFRRDQADSTRTYRVSWHDYLRIWCVCLPATRCAMWNVCAEEYSRSEVCAVM